jgi:carbonic anhydrase
MHVAATVRAVAESDVVREAWAKGVNLQIHGWVYHVGTAKLQDLGIGLKGPGLPSDLIGTPATSAANSRRESIASGPDDKDEVEAK